MKKEVGKFLWNLLDRFMFIGIGVIGTVATTYIIGVLKVNPPELVVTQIYNHIDDRPVAALIGNLKLDYKKDKELPYGVYRVDIRNEGRGSAEMVRFQVKIPNDLTAAYHEKPDFRVYQPTLFEFKNNEFYVEFPKFPSGAGDFVTLRIEGNERLLCDARVKFVSEDYEGEVGKLKGIECK